MPKLIHKLLILLFIFNFYYCNSSVLSQRGSYLKPYHLGQFSLAESNITSIINKEIPKLNYTKSYNAPWLLLDRATLRFAMGKIPEAVQDYYLALESLEYNDYLHSLQTVSQILWQDESAAYLGPDYEQLLARLYFAFALLHAGDRGNAFALLRNAEEFMEKKEYFYKKTSFTQEFHIAENPLIRFLFALLLEKKGDISNANLLYEKLNQPPVYKNEQATVLVLCHNGNAPYKISETCSGSVASALALEFFLAAKHNDLSISTMAGIPIPVLQNWPCSEPQNIFAEIEGNREVLRTSYNVFQAAQNELDQERPVTVAKGVARLLLRRTAVSYMQRQNEFLGMLTDIGMLVANSYTRADTRSWTTLPAVIDMARFDVEAGKHPLNLELSPIFKENRLSFDLYLKPKDLCIIHIFNIHPGVTQIVIPSRFKGEIK